MFLKFNVLLVFLCLCSSAFAHLKIGIYEGQDSQGEHCQIEIIKVTFEGGVRSPLNERVTVSVPELSDPIILAHPEITPGKADKSQLVGINGKSIVRLKMSHTAEKMGPVSFLLATSTDSKITGVVCHQLRFID